MAHMLGVPLQMHLRAVLAMMPLHMHDALGVLQALTVGAFTVAAWVCAGAEAGDAGPCASAGVATNPAATSAMANFFNMDVLFQLCERPFTFAVSPA
jgi:hypothetical protein